MTTNHQPERRHNHTARTIVSLAAGVLARESVRNAAEFLAGHRIPISVACRVLVENRREA